MINSISDAESALRPYVPLVSQLTGKDTTLDRIFPLMKLAGDPQDKVRIVHIAGTSGKTSTAYYMSSLLGASGSSVGLTVSPHVDSITERVQINGQPLDEARFCSYLSQFLLIVEQLTIKPSYFELLYAFSLWVFADQRVDYAVVETGMGGLYDATNVVTRADKFCIITDIGFDHMHILGNTLPEIAAQKIGIAHRDNRVLIYNQAEEIMDVIRARIAKVEASLMITTERAERQQVNMQLSSLPEFQQRNWLLAYAAYRQLVMRDNLRQLDHLQLLESQALQVPGRMDVQYWNGKTLIMDGAHNHQKMTAFVGSFKKRYPDTRPAVLLAMKEGKEYQEISELLAQLAREIVVTTFETSQDLPVRSMDTKVLADSLRSHGAEKVQIIPNQHTAMRYIAELEDNEIIITGSFYLLSQLRRMEHVL